MERRGTMSDDKLIKRKSKMQDTLKSNLVNGEVILPDTPEGKRWLHGFIKIWSEHEFDNGWRVEFHKWNDDTQPE